MFEVIDSRCFLPAVTKQHIKAAQEMYHWKGANKAQLVQIENFHKFLKVYEQFGEDLKAYSRCCLQDSDMKLMNLTI
jgi:hypothetical protein